MVLFIGSLFGVAKSLVSTAAKAVGIGGDAGESAAARETLAEYESALRRATSVLKSQTAARVDEPKVAAPATVPVIAPAPGALPPWALPVIAVAGLGILLTRKR